VGPVHACPSVGFGTAASLNQITPARVIESDRKWLMPLEAALIQASLSGFVKMHSVCLRHDCSGTTRDLPVTGG
jgi:hypothetical protein